MQPGQTTLYFPKPLSAIYGNKEKWATGGAFLRCAPSRSLVQPQRCSAWAGCSRAADAAAALALSRRSEECVAASRCAFLRCGLGSLTRAHTVAAVHHKRRPPGQAPPMPHRETCTPAVPSYSCTDNRRCHHLATSLPLVTPLETPLPFPAQHHRLQRRLQKGQHTADPPHRQRPPRRQAHTGGLTERKMHRAPLQSAREPKEAASGQTLASSRRPRPPQLGVFAPGTSACLPPSLSSAFRPPVPSAACPATP